MKNYVKILIIILTSVILFKFLNKIVGFVKRDNGVFIYKNPKVKLPKYLKPKEKDIEELVIAMCNEDVSWVDDYAHKYKLVTVYNKCGKVVKFKSPNVKVIKSPNIGTCDHAYLSYIINRYNTLPDFIEFTKGWRPPTGNYHNCLPCKEDKEHYRNLMNFKLNDYNFFYLIKN